MSTTTTAPCTNPVPTVQERTCLPCDVPQLCRNSYYRGKLLTERDFNDEQRYGIDKQRLHNLSLHGWGVLCGLVVKPHPFCPEKRVLVTPGLALDDCGREIRLLQEIYKVLPEPPAPGSAGPGSMGSGSTSPGSTNPGSANLSSASQASTSSTAASRPPSRAPVAQTQALDENDEEVEPVADEGCDPTPVPYDLYLCIRYAECETEFSPAPFDDCSCTTSSQKPNRVCEGCTLEIYPQKPEFWDKATREPCEMGDCHSYYRDARDCCPPQSCFPCLPLAVIRNFVAGEPVKEDQIDNWGPRRQLTSTDTLDQIIRCILTKLPTEELTRIENMSWDHDRRMLCREFMEEYIGSERDPRGFRIWFSDKVHSGSIDTRSFQALVVFHPDNPSEPRHMQIAPARVEREEDETGWARLHIDHDYARRHLDGRNFDLFITLRCDVIRDKHHHAVDGNFFRHLPSGDNIQGGNFESWVRVRQRPR